MKRLFAAVLSALSLAAAAADASPVRLDVTVQPNGAQVAVDGEVRGVAPLTLMDVAPGLHLLSVSAPNYRSRDEFVTLEPGAYTQKNFELQPEKGLLLVRTDPAGCDVSYNGLSLGVTPLLLTTLNAGASYRLVLTQNGYQKKTVDVALDGRTPRVLDEQLTLDSGILDISTEPAGAEVQVNGTGRGVSPVTVERVPRGTASVTIKLEGYEDVVREVRVTAGERVNLAVPLKARPSKLTVVTIPEKARVYVDDEFQGRSPVDVRLAGGRHRVRAEFPGFAPMSRDVEVPNGSAVTEEFRLASVMGRLEVVTTPVGAEIWVDDKRVGRTRNERAGAQTSLAFAVENLAEGEHSLTVKAPGHYEARRHFEVAPKKTTELRVALKRMFIADIEVTTISGTVYSGQLLEKQLDGSYRIETRPGVEQTIRAEDIKNVKPLGD